MNKVTKACEAHWEVYKDDCSGFVKAVAKHVGVELTGQANDIVDQMQQTPWKVLKSGREAAGQAQLNFFVLGGLKETGHGHVVVVVPGPVDREAYPTAYWGKLNGTGKKARTINWAWKPGDRDKVIYAFYDVK